MSLWPSAAREAMGRCISVIVSGGRSRARPTSSLHTRRDLCQPADAAVHCRGEEGVADEGYEHVLQQAVTGESARGRDEQNATALLKAVIRSSTTALRGPTPAAGPDIVPSSDKVYYMSSWRRSIGCTPCADALQGDADDVFSCRFLLSGLLLVLVAGMVTTAMAAREYRCLGEHQKVWESYGFVPALTPAPALLLG